MSNNDRIFNAGLIGATAAIEAGRLIVSGTAGNYQGVRDTALTFANRLDFFIPPDPTLTDEDEKLMVAICAQVLAGRFNTSVTAADFNTIALAIIALFTEVRASLAVISSGAVTLNVLTNTVYVDTNTFAATSDGSINNPFVTVQDAVDALPAGGTILIVPGDYSVDSPIVLGDFAYSFVSLSPHNVFGSVNGQANGTAVFLPAVSQTGTAAVLTATGISFDSVDVSTLFANSCELDGAAVTVDEIIGYDCAITTPVFNLALSSVIDRCNFNGDVTFNIAGGANLTMTNTSVIGTTTVGDIIATDCDFGTDLVGSGATELTRCFVQGNISGITQLILNDCTVIGTTACDIVTSMHDSSLTGAITTNAITLAKDCEFGAISIAGANPNRMEGCKYTSLAGIAGSTIASDAYSASWAAVTGGLVRTLISPKATVSVVVPALAANAIGTATAVLTGTVLAGLTTSQQVVGSEPTAGVAGGGFLGSTRISATNTALFTFHGPTTGGAQNFVVTQI